LAAHLDITHDSTLLEKVRPAVTLTVNYLAALWQSANYDCWEEFRDQIHTSTLAALYGGLTAAQHLDPSLVPAGLPETIRAYILETCVAPDGYFVKYVGSAAVDTSLLWTAVPYRVIDVNDPRFHTTLAKIEHDLHRPGGGVYRYKADWYYGGGEWILLTAWLAWTYSELGRVDEARTLMQWIEAQATEQSELPEQVSDHLLVSNRCANGKKNGAK
jgi:GH15 family glucan-1,4-alpha-glucosidase